MWTNLSHKNIYYIDTSDINIYYYNEEIVHSKKQINLQINKKNSSKKQAEQYAAENTLKKLNITSS